jgi:hypothetical protein
MKVRELKRRSGEATVSAWPPQWGSWYRGADKFATSDEGILLRVRRADAGLSLTITYAGREHEGTLLWESPPSIDAVEQVLQAQVGRAIKDIGGIDITTE